MYNFPSSPTLGEQVTAVNGVVYQWDGVKWASVVAATAVTSIDFTAVGMTPGPGATGPITVGGILSVPNGGMGQGTHVINGVLIGAGTNQIKASAASPGAGALLIGQGSVVPTWLGIGSNGQYLTVQSSTPAWTALPAIPAASTTTPIMNGTAAIGSAGTWAQADHVHPTDTSKLSLAGGTLTGQLNGTYGVFVNTMTALSYTTRAGTAAGPQGTGFNIDWESPAALLWINNVNVGTLAFTSDYRIKKDIAPLGPMWERAKALNPISYTHKDYTPPGLAPDQGDVGTRPLVVADDVERWGFIAHELQETLTGSAATGVKDQTDCIQSPNPWPVIATLAKALQEAMARIEALEAQL